MPSDTGIAPGAGAFSLADLANPKPEVDPRAAAIRKEILGNSIAQGISLSDADLEEAKSYGLTVPDPRINQIRQGLQSIPTLAKPGDTSIVGMFKGLVDNFLGMTSAAEGTTPLKPTDVIGVGMVSPVSPFIGAAVPLAAKATEDAIGPALDALHAKLNVTPALPSADIHGLIDQAVGLPKGWTVWKDSVDQQVKDLNSITDTAVANGAVTAEEAKGMDAEVAKLAGTTKPQLSNMENFEQADKKLNDFFNAAKAAHGGSISEFTPEERAQRDDLLNKSDEAANKVTSKDWAEFEANKKNQGQNVNLEQKPFDPNALIYQSEYKKNAIFDAKVAITTFDNQMTEKYGAGSVWYKATVDEQVAYQKLIDKYDQLVGNKSNGGGFGAPPSAASQAQTALADFEGEMKAKYESHGEKTYWQDQMNSDEMEQHDKLFSTVMTYDHQKEIDETPAPYRWTHEIENHINRAPTNKESAAISFYSVSSTALNKFLGTKQAPYGADEDYLNVLHSHINALDSLFKDAAAPKQVVIYRGESYKPNWDKINSIPVGETFINHSFMSTSAQKSVATAFERSPTGTITVVVPKGAKVIPFSGHSNLASEDELLVARDTEFKVLSKKGRNITIEIVPHGGSIGQ